MEHNDQYFEGILQLRNPTKEIMRFVYSVQEKGGIRLVSKEKKVPNGYDLYFMYNKKLLNVGKMLKESFPGRLEVSSRLFSRNRQTSREVYRMSVLFRHFSIKKGDNINFKGDSMKILSLGEKILVQDIYTGKKYSIRYSDFERYSR